MQVPSKFKHVHFGLLEYMKSKGYWKLEKPSDIVIADFLCVDSTDNNILIACMKEWYDCMKYNPDIRPYFTGEVVGKDENDTFFRSRAWKELRYKALIAYGRRCLCCGVTPEDGAVLHVDHIKPRSKYPEQQLNLKNLQVLCKDCNIGKSNKDDTDFRTQH